MKIVMRHMKYNIGSGPHDMDYQPPPVKGKLNNLRIGAVLLARSNYGRWPEKIKADLFGKPLVERVVERIKKVYGYDVIILTTTDREEDKWLKGLAEQYDIEFITGPPDDRGLRVYEVVEKYELDYFSDIATNQPLFDIEAIGQMLKSMRNNPGHECYCYSLVSCDSVVPMIISRQIVERYKKEGTDPEMWHQHLVYQTFVYAWDDSELRNKYLINLNVAYPLDIAIMNKVIQHIGYYPEKHEEIIKAYMEIKTL